MNSIQMDKKTFLLTGDSNFERWALWLGIAGLAACLIGFFIDRSQLFHSYLTAYAFWLTLALGGLFFTMMHHLTNSTWSVVLRRISENVMIVIPLMAVLFIPVLIGIRDLFHWSVPQIVAQEPVLQKKAAYLNIGFFVIRGAVYFLAWTLLARSLLRTSLAQDKAYDEKRMAKMRTISAPGMVVFAFTLTFAAIDWFMSLDARWYSTIFGAYVFAGSTLSTLAFMTLLALYLRGKGILSETITVEHYHDLGKLTFTFIILWAYFAFSQYMLIWYGNIPEETNWYLHRWGGWWTFISMLIVYGHFVLPFVVYISRAAKRNFTVLKIMAVWVLFIHWIDLYWIITPDPDRKTVFFSWMDLAATVGIGGIFLWFFWRRLVANPLVTVNDLRLQASVEFINE